MDNLDEKIKKVMSKEDIIPIIVRNQADTAYKIISEDKEKLSRKKPITMRKINKKKFVFLIAAIVTLFGTTAFAASRYLGVMDFFAKGGKSVPEDTTKLLQTEIKQNPSKNSYVDFKVREAVCDKQKIYIILEVKPIDSTKYVLLTMDSLYNEPVSNLGIVTDKKETIAEYAASEKKEMLYVNTNIKNNNTAILGSIDYTTEEDGTLVIMFTGDNTFDSNDMTITCDTSINTIDQTGIYGEAIKGTFDFKLSDKSSQETASYSHSKESVVENTGVIIDKIQLSKTELGIYTELTYHIAPNATKNEKELAQNGLWFEYLDEQGNAWKPGLSGSDSIEELSNGVYIQKNNFKVNKIPDKITLRGYDCFEKTKFGSVNLDKE